MRDGGCNPVSRCFSLLSILLLACCSREAPGLEDPPAEQARRLAAELMIVDTHIDLPYRLTRHMEDVAVRTRRGDFDYPRAVTGGLDVAFMSIYIPASYQETGGARRYADQLIDMVETIADRHPDRFTMVRSMEQARAAAAAKKLGLALGMENGAGIEGTLQLLEHFHARGIRYITLTHSKNNEICDSSYAEERRWGGLSPFGRQVVSEMNRLGIMIDVSHVSDQTLDQVLELSRAPVIASHSSCRHFTPGWERNLDDDRIGLLARQGGVIQINFGSSFIDDAYRKASQALREQIKSQLQARGIPQDSSEGEAYAERYLGEHPIPRAGVADVADHIDHVVALAGVAHVGFGSDFDGVGDSLPQGLRDVSEYPNLIAELLRRGYTKQDIEAICSGNILRVWSQVERFSREVQGP